ncbi:MAG: hypothetical protein ACLFU1_06975 [Alphaproteobacteria bacterium]
MLGIETARPTAKKLLDHIDAFEEFCLGKRNYTPALFQEINKELSIGAVLMLGRHRYKKGQKGKHLIWKGLDDKEYDLGPLHEANIMRDFPGFHSKRSMSLSNNDIAETQVVPRPDGKGNLSIVIMTDGSVGIGPDYRIALRNAALRMHLKSRFNVTSLTSLWNALWEIA